MSQNFRDKNFASDLRKMMTKLVIMATCLGMLLAINPYQYQRQEDPVWFHPSRRQEGDLNPLVRHEIPQQREMRKRCPRDEDCFITYGNSWGL